MRSDQRGIVEPLKIQERNGYAAYAPSLQIILGQPPDLLLDLAVGGGRSEVVLAFGGLTDETHAARGDRCHPRTPPDGLAVEFLGELRILDHTWPVGELGRVA